MFFNLDTGEERSTGNGMECWVADGNVWIAGHGVETSISNLNIQMFCSFLNRTIDTFSYLEMDEIDGLHISLEDEDEGTRNLCFSQGKLFLCFNVSVINLQKLARFLLDQ